MFCSSLHHPGFATIEFKTFFHMCKLEGINLDIEKRLGSQFALYDTLQSGILGLITVGVHRR